MLFSLESAERSYEAAEHRRNFLPQTSNAGWASQPDQQMQASASAPPGVPAVQDGHLR